MDAFTYYRLYVPFSDYRNSFDIKINHHYSIEYKKQSVEFEIPLSTSTDINLGLDWTWGFNNAFKLEHIMGLAFNMELKIDFFAFNANRMSRKKIDKNSFNRVVRK